MTPSEWTSMLSNIVSTMVLLVGIIGTAMALHFKAQSKMNEVCRDQKKIRASNEEIHGEFILMVKRMDKYDTWRMDTDQRITTLEDGHKQLRTGQEQHEQRIAAVEGVR